MICAFQSFSIISPVHGFPVKNNSRKWIFSFKLSTLVISPIKFNVRSSFCSDSHPFRFSTSSMLFIARFTYSSFFNLWRFSGWKVERKFLWNFFETKGEIELLPILGIKLDCSRRILSSRHQSWMFSILSIFSWCSESSSRLKMRSSLCSDFFRISCSVTAIN